MYISEIYKVTNLLYKDFSGYCRLAHQHPLTSTPNEKPNTLACKKLEAIQVELKGTRKLKHEVEGGLFTASQTSID